MRHSGVKIVRGWKHDDVMVTGGHGGLRNLSHTDSHVS